MGATVKYQQLCRDTHSSGSWDARTADSNMRTSSSDAHQGRVPCRTASPEGGEDMVGDSPSRRWHLLPQVSSQN